MNLLGVYAPLNGVITTYYPTEVQDKYPKVTYWHEYYHHVLTTGTDLGTMDRLFSNAIVAREIPASSISLVESFIKCLFDMSFSTHEGTATYLSLVYGLEDSLSAPKEIVSYLPVEYQQAVELISPPFPQPECLTKESFLIHQSVLLGCARVALEILHLDKYIAQRPITWQSLTQFLLNQNSDKRFQRILHALTKLALDGGIECIVQPYACEFWNIPTSNWYQRVGELISKTDESHNTAFLDGLAIHIDTAIHGLCDELGPYVGREQRIAQFVELVKICNTDLRQTFPSGLFREVVFRPVAGDPSPKGKTMVPDAQMDSWVFASVAYQSIQLSDIIYGAMLLEESRKHGVDLWFQNRVFINPTEEVLPLDKNYALPPMHTIFTFLPWIPSGSEEKSKRAKLLGPFIGSPSCIVLPNSEIHEILEVLKKTEVLWHIDWIMYHFGRKAGFIADQLPGLKLILCENADSEIFRGHVLEMSHNSQVHLYAKAYRQKSVFVLVAYESGSLLRWSIAVPEPIAYRMIESVEEEQNITFLGKADQSKIEEDCKADISLIFHYGL